MSPDKSNFFSELYRQQMQLLTQEYEMRNNRRQFLHQQDRDRVSDNQWQQQYEYQKQRDAINDSQWQQQFDYQKQRDAVSDSQWQKQYELSKKANASRSKSSSTSSKNNVVMTESKEVKNNQMPSINEVMRNIKPLAGPGNPGILDGISGRNFPNIESVLKYYGYATAN